MLFRSTNGTGAGDMTISVYDPQGKAQDVFAYVDEAVNSIPTPDVSGQIETHNTDTTAHADIRATIEAIEIPTVPTNVSAFTNDSGYITESAIPTNISTFTNDVGYITSDAIPTVPTNVSAFTNDSGYITESAIPTNISTFTNDSGYTTKTYVDTAIGDIATILDSINGEVI